MAARWGSEYPLLSPKNPESTTKKHYYHAMGPWKAPSPDGFPAGFYQGAWETVEDSLFEFVQHAWYHPASISNVNLTDICLIPKISHLGFVNQFRPISLCNVSYKILTKMVVNRLKPLIPKLVSPYQTGFVPGQCIHDNIVVAQEMLHSMAKMQGKTGFFVIKVDLSKAYDMLRWSCNHEVLREIGLPAELVHFIMDSIASVQTNIL